MSHSHHHTRHHHHTHRHRPHVAAGATTGAATGAAFAGAGTVGARFFGQQQTREFAETIFEKMPKSGASGLAVGFMVGGATGAYLMYEHQSHATSVVESRQKAPGAAR